MKKPILHLQAGALSGAAGGGISSTEGGGTLRSSVLLFVTLGTLASGAWAPSAQSAINYLGQSTANTGQSTATSLTIPKPAGAAVGEVLVAVIGGFSPSSTVIPAPAGWTVINNTPYGSINLPTFYHVVQAGDPASWTWTTTGSQSLNGTLLRYSGVDTANPLDVAAAATDSTATAAPIAPSVTTVTAGARVIRAYAANPGGVPTATPATARVMVSLNGGVNNGVSDSLQATAGATGTASFTLSTPIYWRALTFALRPADALAGQISGSVYRDYNANGTRGANDPGLEGIAVKAVDANGNTATTTTVGPDGAYTIVASAGVPAALSGRNSTPAAWPTYSPAPPAAPRCSSPTSPPAPPGSTPASTIRWNTARPIPSWPFRPTGTVRLRA
jgi:hypothetical protein